MTIDSGTKIPNPACSSQPPPAVSAGEAWSDAEPTIPAQQALEIRRLVHDLSNGLEIIIQSSYLLGTCDLPEDSRRWLKLLEEGVEHATRVNQELRAFILAHSQASPSAPTEVVPPR